MRLTRNTIAFVLTASLAVPAAPRVASAGNFGAAAAGAAFGTVLGVIIAGGAKSGRTSGPKHASPPSGTGSGKGREENRGEAALASLGVDKNLDGVLRTVTFKSVEASAGTNDSVRVGKRGRVATNKADLQSELAVFVKQFNTMADGTTQAGDVSRVTVESALEDIYEAKEQAGLRAFENLPGENWAPEQLKFKIVAEARRRLEKFKSGNNKGLVTMAQVRQLLAESTRDVYLKLFEISELIGLNKHVADFDRELYEGGRLGDMVETASTPVATPPEDEEAYPGDLPVRALAESDQPSPSSKMKFITPEMIRIARLLADDVPLDLGREDRDYAEAFRYRLTRATVDCFIALATKKADLRTPEPATDGKSDDAARTEVLDERYEDLIKTFQAAIARRDTTAAASTEDAAKNDRDGICRAEIYRLADLGDGGAVKGKAGREATNRDLSLLKEPQAARAVWTGTGWDSGGAAVARGN